jgi:hypothetical protein
VLDATMIVTAALPAARAQISYFENKLDCRASQLGIFCQKLSQTPTVQPSITVRICSAAHCHDVPPRTAD